MELARNLKIDSISRLQPARPLRLDHTCSVTAAVGLMRKHRGGCVLVCDGRAVVGIFTERDLLRRVIAAGKSWETPVADVMTPDPVCVLAKDPIRLAVRRMEQGGYRHLPVVDDTGRPVGVLSARRIVHYLAEHFPATVYNLPPDPRAVPDQPEGA
ncbi:MAG TPA: CBS domain-containing protein [Gemmataceae bacterium]|jgi:CBS domain-containing protein